MSEAAGLDLGAAITRLTTAVGERVLGVRADSGLSAVQLQVLRLAADGATVSTLTHILGTPKSTMTSVIDQLEALGLVLRITDEDDRRRQIVRDTAAGAARLREFDRQLAGQIEQFVVALSPARARRLEELMAKLPSASVPLPLAGPR